MVTPTEAPSVITGVMFLTNTNVEPLYEASSFAPTSTVLPLMATELPAQKVAVNIMVSLQGMPHVSQPPTGMSNR